MNLLTVNGHATRLSRSQLISAGGTDFRLGSLRAPQLRRWAIVVGVDAYPPPFQSLKYAANDAKAVKETLQEAGFMVTLMTPDSLLQPTKENIIHQLEWHGQLEEIDLLTVYLSGHGEDVGGTGYFLPMDVTDPLAQSGLSMEDMFALLNTANAKHRFVIVDACRIAPKQHFITALSRYSEESNIIFTACDSNQWAPEVPRLKHGLFTYFLLKGLRGSSERDRGAAASDGTVTVLGLLDYVTRGIEDWHAHLPTDLRMPQQITPRVFYNGKYISLLNNQGINPMLLNNRGLASRFIDWISPITSTPSIGPQNGQKQYTHMPVTISFVPGVSTAGPVGRNVVTNLSFNILAGYSAKLDGLEFGGIANLQKEEARGAQFAGVANLVGGYVEGFSKLLESSTSPTAISTACRHREAPITPKVMFGWGSLAERLMLRSVTLTACKGQALSIMLVEVSRAVSLAEQLTPLWVTSTACKGPEPLMWRRIWRVRNSVWSTFQVGLSARKSVWSTLPGR